jgi:hypothetical protein
MSTALPPPLDAAELVDLLEDVLLLLPHPATAITAAAKMEQTNALFRYTLTPLLGYVSAAPM